MSAVLKEATCLHVCLNYFSLLCLNAPPAPVCVANKRELWQWCTLVSYWEFYLC